MNPYEILNVSKNASNAEIKKAYRKLAAKHHPDKGGDEEIFKQVNEAYSAIENEEKRQEYEASQNFGGFGDIFGDIFEGFFGNRSRSRRQPREQTDDEIIFDFKFSLSQIKEGISQNIVFNRNRKCTSCNGIGGKNKKICLICNGQGVQTTRSGRRIQQSTCRSCLGHGHTLEERCSFCAGAGQVQVRENIKFTLENK